MYVIEPITIIWFVAIPLLDCIGLLVSRILKGLSWATPGRDHIHHKLMNKFSSLSSLMILLFVSLIVGILGIYLQNNYPIWISTLLFLLFSLVYYCFAYRIEIKTLLSKNV